MIISKNPAQFNQSEFLSSVCHEFKTPVSAIISMADLLKDMIKEEKIEKEKLDIDFCLDEISKTAEDLLELTQDFLDVNDNKDSIFKVDLSQKIDVAESINRSVRVNYDYSLKKNIKLSYYIDEKLKPIRLDQKRLKQILSNLISNALKYSNNNTEVDVIAKKITKTNASGIVKDCLEISVEDHGIGMSQEQIEVAFSKYGVVSKNKQNNVDSYGMGLAIVKKLVELQNGEIEVLSEFNKGTTIKIRFNYY